MNFSNLKKKTFASVFLAAFCIPLAQAEQLGTQQLSSIILEDKSIENEIYIQRPKGVMHPTDCNLFVNPRSVACLGPDDYSYQPQDRLDRLVIKTAEYAGRFVPLLNSNAEGSAYTNIVIDDGRQLISDAGYKLVNNFSNDQIQKIPFFAQTTVTVSGTSDSLTNFSVDSLMKLKEMAVDSEGDLKTLLFSQAKLSRASSSDSSTTNLGLGIRHRPNDLSMFGGNAFWDYRMTNYSDAHSRLGLGGEYFNQGWELRNNWYMSITDKKTVTVDGSEFTEKVVPGWDVEAGYRFPNRPDMAVFVKGFSWDYTHTQDNSGVEGSFNWQATPHVNLEFWASNELFAGKTVVNSKLPNTDERYVGLRFKWTARPVKFEKQNIKQNLLTQMTQPVRRKYDVLLERSAGGFANRAKGS
ncbi:inverse autotransporter beta domain-containing protein [Prochlorococcus marinus]|uniref:inverse autotransporter beta domain-containing protein n=1 Tax=Prochlorococcus marinus TaxID=1219 RepID=UPI0022B4DC8D|nr:inverse autotransporter beta domain-containing protein [Prochlorococcus marinus]